MEWYEDAFLDVEVLKMGHHGSSATSTHEKWANKTKPRTAIASAAYRSQHGHPRDIVVTRLEGHVDADDPPHSMMWSYRQNGRRRWTVDHGYVKSIYSTSVTGNVRVYSDGESWWVEEELAPDRLYRIPCYKVRPSQGH